MPCCSLQRDDVRTSCCAEKPVAMLSTSPAGHHMLWSAAIQKRASVKRNFAAKKASVSRSTIMRGVWVWLLRRKAVGKRPGQKKGEGGKGAFMVSYSMRLPPGSYLSGRCPTSSGEIDRFNNLKCTHPNCRPRRRRSLCIYRNWFWQKSVTIDHLTFTFSIYFCAYAYI